MSEVQWSYFPFNLTKDIQDKHTHTHTHTHTLSLSHLAYVAVNEA
jgi:hypothetical protein